jgi:hypothetical protein
MAGFSPDTHVFTSTGELRWPGIPDHDTRIDFNAGLVPTRQKIPEGVANEDFLATNP